MYRMVLDTDAFNEVDDQFALVYTMLSKEMLTVEAVFAAPFANVRFGGPEGGMQKSYGEIIRLLDILQMNREHFVYKGAKHFIKSPDTPCDSDASNRLIELALESTENNPLHVVSIGAPTNISSAIIRNPDIISRIKVIWLGGNGMSWLSADEFNLRQDLTASKILFDSKVKLVQIPCYPVASHLSVSIPELKANMGESDISAALISLIEEALGGDQMKTRIIWDLSAVAYLVNREWVKTVDVHSPILRDDLHYALDEKRHLIQCAYHIDRDAVFGDFYKKINMVGK